MGEIVRGAVAGSLLTVIKLEADQYGAAAGLLDQAPFNVLMARAVLASRVDGVAYADSPIPSSVYVQHKYGMSWLVGYPDDDGFVQEVASALADPSRRSSPEWLQVYPLDWTEILDPLAAAGRIKAWHRTNFWFNEARFRARFARGDGRTAACEKDEVDRFTGSVIPHHFWDSTDEFLEMGGGFFSISDDDEVAAIAFASYADAGHLELGVETIPQHRGRGHAQAACARLIYDCIDRGLTPVWSCRTENEGSFFLAQKLGFVPFLQLPYYELPFTPEQ